MPTSPKQAAANRRNATKSTGPRTPAGKAASSSNALKHGILSRGLVLDGTGETNEDFAAFLDALRQDLAPQDVLEERLVEQISVCYWRLGRVVRAESGTGRSRLESDRYRNALSKYHRVESLIRSIKEPGAATGHLRASLQKSSLGLSWLISILKRTPTWEGDAPPPPDEALRRIHIVFGTEDSELGDALRRLRDAPETADSASEHLARLVPLLDERAEQLTKDREPLLRQEEEEYEREANAALLLEPARVELVLRYEKSVTNTLHRALDELGRRQHQRRGRTKAKK